MERRKVCLILLVCWLLLFALRTYALDLDDYSSIRCSGGFVSMGASRYSVLEECGRPTYQEDSGDTWVYDYGPEEFVVYITFVDDRVERIQRGDYGTER